MAEIESLERQISSVNTLLQSVERQRSLLATALLTQSQTLAHLQQNTPPTPRLTRAISNCLGSSLATLSFGRRITTGITAFQVKDPDPYAVDSSRVLGLKFDIYSRQARSFDPPYFVFLVRATPTDSAVVVPQDPRDSVSTTWKIHKHTVPAVVPIRALARQFLPLGSISSNAVLEGSQDIGAFARAVRRALLGMTRRKSMLKSLKSLYEDLRLVDGIGREVEFDVIGQLRVRIAFNAPGDEIEKIVVRSIGVPGLEGRRRDIERDVLRRGADLNALQAVLKQNRAQDFNRNDQA